MCFYCWTHLWVRIRIKKKIHNGLAFYSILLSKKWMVTDQVARRATNQMNFRTRPCSLSRYFHPWRLTNQVSWNKFTLTLVLLLLLLLTSWYKFWFLCHVIVYQRINWLKYFITNFPRCWACLQLGKTATWQQLSHYWRTLQCVPKLNLKYITDVVISNYCKLVEECNTCYSE